MLIGCSLFLQRFVIFSERSPFDVVDHSHSGKVDVWLHHPALVGLLPWQIASWYVYFSSISLAWLWWRVTVVVDSSQAVGVGLLLLRGYDGVFCPVL